MPDEIREVAYVEPRLFQRLADSSSRQIWIRVSRAWHLVSSFEIPAQVPSSYLQPIGQRSPTTCYSNAEATFNLL
jgi:hypothetical protein